MTGDNRNVKLSLGVLSVVVLLLAQLVAFAFTYGTLSGQVRANSLLIEQNRILQQDVSRQLSDYNARLARIEAILSGIVP